MESPKIRESNSLANTMIHGIKLKERPNIKIVKKKGCKEYMMSLIHYSNQPELSTSEFELIDWLKWDPSLLVLHLQENHWCVVWECAWQFLKQISILNLTLTTIVVSCPLKYLSHLPAICLVTWSILFTSNTRWFSILSNITFTISNRLINIS